MSVFRSIREQRRVSGGIVVALLILGAMVSLHHHPLAAPADALRLSQASADGQPDRSVDCVVCRALDPVQLVLARGAAPPLLVARTVPELAAGVLSLFLATSFSPRAPPAAV